ncbi:pirin family protein [Solimonas terrae]|uniref:Pirin family protein n=1 Tax=Solimonas terrae TaxID=1396819 RepID=A0A6M2BYB1_9GAMM|nr:pirin family protein [Solimonas terrae]NGY06849.1 pirin family protein [Solimonas terrae]
MDIIRADQRGVAEHGWLSSRHTFSFGSYYNPQQIGFSDLRVINDDHVEPGEGFGRHPHRDMEIFSYVLDGALEHRDSMGTGSVIRPGDVQIMSAGSGVAHSEYNHSKVLDVHFLQIWIMPAVTGAEPRYQQRHFTEDEKRGRLRLILSPDGGEDSLQIRQDVRVWAGLFDGDESATLELPAQRHGYVHVARGAIELNGETLAAGDGLRLRGGGPLRFAGGQDAEVLVFDLRPFEVPQAP